MVNLKHDFFILHFFILQEHKKDKKYKKGRIM